MLMLVVVSFLGISLEYVCAVLHVTRHAPIHLSYARPFFLLGLVNSLIQKLIPHQQMAYKIVYLDLERQIHMSLVDESHLVAPEPRWTVESIHLTPGEVSIFHIHSVLEIILFHLFQLQRRGP